MLQISYRIELVVTIFICHFIEVMIGLFEMYQSCFSRPVRIARSLHKSFHFTKPVERCAAAKQALLRLWQDYETLLFPCYLSSDPTYILYHVMLNRILFDYSKAHCQLCFVFVFDVQCLGYKHSSLVRALIT